MLALLHGANGPVGVAGVVCEHLHVRLAGVLTKPHGIHPRGHTDLVDLVHGCMLELHHGGIG